MLTKRLFIPLTDCRPIPVTTCVTSRVIKIAYRVKYPSNKPVDRTDRNWSIVVCPVSFVLCVNINKIIPNHEMDYL